MPIIVAIDGPAGCGKSTVAKKLAENLGLDLVDTGAIYRCVALEASRAGISYEDHGGLSRIIPAMDVSFRFEKGTNRVFLRGEDVSDAVRTPEMSMGASAVSARKPVRDGLLGLQRRLGRAAKKGAVLEGRDIGTVVFPDADLKFFLTASPEVRARRRFDELVARGETVAYEQVLADQERRDRDDSTRAIAPLRPAPDARIIDTSHMALDEVVRAVEQAVSARLG